jgi:phosphoglucomutase
MAGPANSGVTRWIEREANELLKDHLRGVKRIPCEEALRLSTTHEHDFLGAYVNDLGHVMDMELIRSATIRMGVDPLGGAGVHYWSAIAARYALDLTVVNEVIEESAGASFLRLDGTVWTTDKDGIVPCLLSAEMTARTGRDPGETYQELAREFGQSYYERVDAPATPQQKKSLENLSQRQVTSAELAGEKIQKIFTHAPGNGEPIGGLKVVAENGWFAARPSGTEEIYKIYAESFRGVEHLNRIVAEAQAIVMAALAAEVQR